MLTRVGIEGIEAARITSFLWDKHRIIVDMVAKGDLPGLQFDLNGFRVTADIYMQLEEADTSAAVMEDIEKNGIGG